jgi:hypothetical protein
VKTTTPTRPRSGSGRWRDRVDGAVRPSRRRGADGGLPGHGGRRLLDLQPGHHKGAELVNEIGSWTWNQLASRDLEAAKKFYGDVFDWTSSAHRTRRPTCPIWCGRSTARGGRRASPARW